MKAQTIIAAAIANVKNQSAYRLARILGVSDTAISQWRHGRNLPRAKHLLKMMEIAEGKKQKGLATITLLAALAGTTGLAAIAAGPDGPFYTLYDYKERRNAI